MAGHSKWANIKHRKGAQDAKRSKMFMKFSKEIMVAASQGGGDPYLNSSLRLAITKAKAKSMPKSNIDKAIAKATGALKDGALFKENIYSGNLAGGVIFLVTTLSDNENRVVATIQHLFNRAGGKIGKSSSIPFGFSMKGIIEFDSKNLSEEEIMLVSIDAGALDFVNENGLIKIQTDSKNLDKIKEVLEKNGVKQFNTVEKSYVSEHLITFNEEKLEKLLETMDKFEDDEDIQAVYHNIDFSKLNLVDEDKEEGIK